GGLQKIGDRRHGRARRTRPVRRGRRRRARIDRWLREHIVVERDRHFLPALRGTPPPFLADSGPIGLGLTLEYRARPLIGCRGIRSTLRDRVPARGGEQRGREQQNRIAARQHRIYITLRVWPGSGKSRARRSLSRHRQTTGDRPRRALSTAPPFPPVLNR